MWLYQELQRHGHDYYAVVPEVSRTFHAGSGGTHVTAWEQQIFFSNRLVNTDPMVDFDDIDR